MLIGDQDVPAINQADTLGYTVEEGYHFENGDTNRDGVINLTDILNLIAFVYVEPIGEPEPCNWELGGE